MSEYAFKLAVCNELYEKTDFAASCRSLKKAGWQGIEIAPFTLRNDATTLPAERRKEVRNIIQSEGLEFVGLHWLTVGPTGLHVTTPDEAMRKHSWDFVRRLVDLCADLRQGDSGGVMVFGSPMQRKTTGGLSPQQATTHFIDGVRSITGHLEDLGVTLLVEALPSEQCDVIGSLDEAIKVVREVNSPSVRSMFDSHNAIEETTPHSPNWSRSTGISSGISTSTSLMVRTCGPAEVTTSSQSCRSRKIASLTAGSRWKSSTLRRARRRWSTNPSPIFAMRSPG